MHGLRTIPNATILLHTMALPSVKLVEHVRYAEYDTWTHYNI